MKVEGYPKWWYEPLSGAMSGGSRVGDKMTGKVGTEVGLYINWGKGCNLKCDGCAVGSGEQEGGLSGQKVKEWIEGHEREWIRQGREIVVIKHAGGEPTLPGYWKEIEKLEVRLNKMRVREVVLTNGTRIDQEKVETMRARNMRVSVSLWGLDEEHNQARGVRNRATDGFAATRNGVDVLVKGGVKTRLYWVTTPENANKTRLLPQLVKDWGVEGLGIGIIRPDKENIQELIEKGCGSIVAGLMGYLRELEERAKDGQGDKITLTDMVGHMQPFGFPTNRVCGAGGGYMTLTNDGYGGIKTLACHEMLKKETSIQWPVLSRKVRLNSKLNFDTMTTLRAHGGTGCPMQQVRQWGEVGKASWETNVYAEILPQWLKTRAAMLVAQ